MKFIRPLVCASLLAVSSDFASASLITTSNGFVDSATNLEWLAPSKITSLSDYNAYSDNGWRVATTGDISSILTGGYYFSSTVAYQPFDASIFNAFGTIANSNNCGLYGVQATYCTEAWIHNVGTNGADNRYEIETIALVSNPAQIDPALVSQQKLAFGTFWVTSTIGSYPLYGTSNLYSTFMVRAVPLPGAAYMFMSALLMALPNVRRRLFK